jgi:acetoin utilization deacetylase AcuC-like enzyme
LLCAGLPVRVFTDPRCLGHRAPGYPERPERLAGVLGALRERGFEVVETGESPERADDAREAVVAVHDPSYVDRFGRAVARGDALIDSADNPLVADTGAAAWGAVTAVLAAADWVAEAPGRRAFAAVRPPGHHAERALAMGFCYFNNAAVAAERLRRRHGADRVAVFDFDVHHGNGTQHLFEERADVFYASAHQVPFYPGTGAAGEVGRGAGRGATLNVPLPAGTGDDGYAAAIEGTVFPALRAFAPDFLVVSAGFDAWRHDPLGGMAVTREGFAHWGRLLSELAAELCEGRLLGVLEGGYDLAALPDLVATYLSAASAAAAV